MFCLCKISEITPFFHRTLNLGKRAKTCNKISSCEVNFSVRVVYQLTNLTMVRFISITIHQRAYNICILHLWSVKHCWTNNMAQIVKLRFIMPQNTECETVCIHASTWFITKLQRKLITKQNFSSLPGPRTMMNRQCVH